MKRAWGQGAPCSARSALWPGGCPFKRSGGAGARGRRARCHGTRAAGAAGPLGSLVSSCLRQCRGCAALGLQRLGLDWPVTTSARSLLPVPPAGVELLPRPPLQDTLRSPRERARHLQLLPSEPNFCAGFGLADPEQRTARSWGGGLAGLASL